MIIIWLQENRFLMHMMENLMHVGIQIDNRLK